MQLSLHYKEILNIVTALQGDRWWDVASGVDLRWVLIRLPEYVHKLSVIVIVYSMCTRSVRLLNMLWYWVWTGTIGRHPRRQPISVLKYVWSDCRRQWSRCLSTVCWAGSSVVRGVHPLACLFVLPSIYGCLWMLVMTLYTYCRHLV